MLVSTNNLNQSVLWYSVFVISCLVISLLISLLSFVPRLKVPWVRLGECNSNDNLLYFGNACKYSGAGYLQAMYTNGLDISKNQKIDLAYSDQIVVNSKIAYIKFKQFDTAIWFTIIALITPVGALFVAGMRN